jgi:SAM-dependent methyltransferase
MRSTFPLFQSHLDLAHAYWKQLLTPFDSVIDATCGNGKDTLFLASIVTEGKLFGIDIQKEAIQNTRQLLASSIPKRDHVKLFEQSHCVFPEEISPESISLIVYNLGYLPGGNKQLTTIHDHTLKSVQAALLLLKKGGVITLTCYPGHPEGKIEETLLLKWGSSCSPKEWSFCHHRWLNRENAPSLIVIQKMM